MAVTTNAHTKGDQGKVEKPSSDQQAATLNDVSSKEASHSSTGDGTNQAGDNTNS